MSSKKIKDSELKELYDACLKLRYPEEENVKFRDENMAMKFLIDFMRLSNYMNSEAAKHCKANPEMDFESLRLDMNTILYESIRNSFSKGKDYKRIFDWLCSRVHWRTKDYVRKECDLRYEQFDGLGASTYSKPFKLSLNNIDSFLGKQHTSKGHKQHGFDGVNLEQLTPLLTFQRNDIFENILKHSPIRPEYKIMLLLVNIFGYTFQELTFFYNVNNAGSIWPVHNEAVKAFKEHVEEMTEDQRLELANSLNRKEKIQLGKARNSLVKFKPRVKEKKRLPKLKTDS